MDDQLEHLPLPFVEETIRKRRVGKRSYKERKDKKRFYDVQVQKFDEFRKNLEKDKKRYRNYLDPNLIFKIIVNQDVDEDTFRGFLKSKGVEVISPAPDKKGFWVVFAEDETLKDFREKLREYVESDKHKLFHVIEDISEIPPDEKIGERLKKEPIKEDEVAYLDVEIWRMDDARLKTFLLGLKKLIEDRGGKITDEYTTKSFSLLRVRIDKKTFDEILPLREIARIDRPPKASIKADILSIPLEEIDIGDSPPDDATGILVVDSGIRSAHPLLEGAVGDEIAVATRKSNKISENDTFDEVGHGTMVAGIALYGDIGECLVSRRFNREIWIFSAKVMYKDEFGYAKYDEEELLEHQLYKAIKYFVENYSNCKVINLSLGDETKVVREGMRQFPIASLIDELSKDYGVVFVVSAGNINDWFLNREYYIKHYPNYLIDDSNNYSRIIEPATASLAITVGSVFSISDLDESFRHFRRFEVKNFPSPFSRVGFGYKGMLKPELVENGGGSVAQDSSDLVITLNPEWISEGRLFTKDCGTSFSAPKIAHYIAKLMNKYTMYSPNLIKALLISSAEIPKEEERPEELKDADFRDILRIYGYGIPNLNRAMYSERSRVLLLRENKIKLNSVHLYAIYLPDEFVKTNGKKKISVTLVYDPPTNRNRSDYLGVSMEFHLFRNTDIETVRRVYSEISPENEDDEQLPENIKNNKLNLKPGVRLRKKGVHQKGVIEFSKMEFDTDKPLVLVVICRDVWVKDESYLQDYAVVVEIEHSASIDLYNQIRLRNRERVRV